MPKKPAQLFEDQMRDRFGSKGQNFSAYAVLINGRELRVTVLNPDQTKFRTKPAGDDSVAVNARLNLDCFRALQLMQVAISALPQGTDPGYYDYQKWKWPVTVEWGWTTPETLKTKLNRYTFTAAQTREGTRQCVRP